MRRCSREMVWKRELTVTCCQELTLIFSRNDNYRIRYTADEMSYRKTFAGFLFKMKFWLSSVCSFQVTNKFMEIAGNRWFKNCIMILGTISACCLNPNSEGRITAHWKKTCEAFETNFNSRHDYSSHYISWITHKCWWVINEDCFRILKLELIGPLCRCNVPHYTWQLGIF